VLSTVLLAACGADKGSGDDAGAGEPKAERKDTPKGKAWKPGDPLVRVEGGELLGEGAGPAPGEQLRVGIVGDSITQGGVFVHRYPRTLQKLLRDSFPGAAVEPYAIPGEICEELEARLETDIIARRPGYHALIIQCGTNDLHNGLTVGRVSRSIERMTARARTAGMRVILLTVPPLWGHPGWTEDKEARRATLNEWILDRAGVVPVDTAASLSEGSPPRLRAEFVHVDHVHPNRQGLDAMARAIWQAAFAGGWRSVGPYIRYREEE
jgi:lysophospholipase L1-like esterase